MAWRFAGAERLVVTLDSVADDVPFPLRLRALQKTASSSTAGLVPAFFRQPRAVFGAPRAI